MKKVTAIKRQKKQGIALPTDDPKMMIVLTGITLAGGYLGYKAYQRYKKKQEEQNAGSDPNTRIAMQIRDAVKSWLGGSSTILNIARQGMDASGVSKSYQRMYSSSMYDDVRKKLNQTEYAEFMSLIGSVKPGTDYSSQPAADKNTYVETANKNKLVFISKDTSVYDPSRKAIFFSLIPYRVLRSVKAGAMLNRCTTTGDVLTLAYPIKTDFYGIVVKTDSGSIRSALVKKTDVRLLTEAEFNTIKPTVKEYISFTDKDFTSLF